MDYSNSTVAKRTRLQHDLFYKKFNEEKKRKKAKGGIDSDSEVNGSARVNSDSCSVNPGDGGSVGTVNVAKSRKTVIRGESTRLGIKYGNENAESKKRGSRNEGGGFEIGDDCGTSKIVELRRPATRSNSWRRGEIVDGSGIVESRGGLRKNGSRVGVEDDSDKVESVGADRVLISRKPVTRSQRSVSVGINDGFDEGQNFGRSKSRKKKQRIVKDEDGDDGSKRKKKSAKKGVRGKENEGSMGACLKGKSLLGKNLKADVNAGNIFGEDEFETDDDDVIFVKIENRVAAGVDSGNSLGRKNVVKSRKGLSRDEGGSKTIKKKLKRGFKNQKKVGLTGDCLKEKSPLGQSSKKEGNLGKFGRVDEDDGSESGSDDDVICLGESVTSNDSCLNVGSVLGSGSRGEYVLSRIELGGREDSEGKGSASDEARSKIGDLMESEDINECETKDVATDDSESSSEDDDPDDADFSVDSSSTCGDDDDDDDEEYASETNEEEDEECILVDKRIGDGKENNNSPEVGEEVEEEDEGHDDEGDGMCEIKEERSVIVDGLKRKRACGLDIVIDCDKQDGEEQRGPALRLRSRSPSKSKENKLQFGGVSQPVPAEYYELDSSPGARSDVDDDGCHKNDVQKADRKEKSKSGKTKKSPKKALNVIKIFIDSILDDENKPLERYANPEEKPCVKATLSYKFRFEDEDEVAKPPTKSDWEIEADALFTELDLALKLQDIGSFNATEVDEDDTEIQGDEIDRAALCLQGKHQLILREPYGIMCRFCSYVDLEMKHIFPPLTMNPFERRQGYHFDKADCLDFSELQIQEEGSECLYGSKGWNHEKGTVWDLIPGVGRTMYPHQREGFEFIWKSIAGGVYIEKLEKPLPDGGSGCIISHAPGTGKSRLTIAFLQTFMRLYPESRPVIIAPRSMLLTWEEEFKKWNFDIPFHNLNKPEFSGRESAAALNLLQRARNGGRSTNNYRLCKLYSWKKESSILGITYSLFEKLAGGGGKRKKLESNPVDEFIRECLLKCPSLLVLDEGHTPRNKESLIYQALSKVKTQRCILLSGTPFQNNFEELYNILSLVNPEFVEHMSFSDSSDFVKRRGRKSSVARGRWDALTSSIGGNHKRRLCELRGMIDPFVHVHKGNILQQKLPGLRDSLVILKPTEMQQTLLESIRGQLSNFLKKEALMSLISVHPSLFRKKAEFSALVKKEEFSALENELKRLERNPYAGVKTKFLIELIRISEQLNEKVLVFSKYISPIFNFLIELLETHFNWIEGKEVLRMDGQLDEKQRQSSISSFNDPNSDSKVLLASIKACGEGINLVGASRVVLLDVNWNPSVEQQAISRAYRLGQKKVVYVYHLVTGMLEGEKYERQVEKDRLSELVFSCKSQHSFKQEISSTVSQDKILEEMVQHEKLYDIFEKVVYQPKESDLFETFSMIDPEPQQSVVYF